MVEFKEIDDYNFPFEIGVLPRQELAIKFVDHLASKGIKASAKPGFGANYGIFVAKQSDISPAKLELLRFGNNPFAKEFNRASWAQGRVLKKPKSLSSGFMKFSMGQYMWTPFSLTSIIEIVCIVLFILMAFSPQLESTLSAMFCLYRLSDLTFDFQLYRLITPIFLHFGILHIAFNLVMFEAFARPIERFLGLGKLLLLLLVIGVSSNCLEFIINLATDRSSMFGGMSGVVYGLIGYMCVLSQRNDLPYGLKVPKGLLTVSLIFVALGFFMSNVANFCHIGGLAMGVLLAFIDFKRPLRMNRG